MAFGGDLLGTKGASEFAADTVERSHSFNPGGVQAREFVVYLPDHRSGCGFPKAKG